MQTSRGRACPRDTAFSNKLGFWKKSREHLFLLLLPVKNRVKRERKRSKARRLASSGMTPLAAPESAGEAKTSCSLAQEQRARRSGESRPQTPARSARLSRKHVRLSLLPSPPPGDMGTKIARSGEDAVTRRDTDEIPAPPAPNCLPPPPIPGASLAVFYDPNNLPPPPNPTPAWSISRSGASSLFRPLLPGLQGGAAASVAPSLGFLDSPSPLNIWLRGLVFQMCLLGGQMCAFPPPMAWRPACLGGRVGGPGSFLKSRRNLSPQASGLGLLALRDTGQNEVSNPDPTPLPNSLQKVLKPAEKLSSTGLSTEKPCFDHAILVLAMAPQVHSQ